MNALVQPFPIVLNYVFFEPHHRHRDGTPNHMATNFITEDRWWRIRQRRAGCQPGAEGSKSCHACALHRVRSIFGVTAPRHSNLI